MSRFMCILKFSYKLKLCGLILAIAACNEPRLQLEPVLPPTPLKASRIAFGSCNDYYSSQPRWEPMAALKPQLFIWTGDIVYADENHFLPLRGFAWFRWPASGITESDLRGAYARQKSLSGYRKLRDTARVLGIYDDHDYGKDIAGKEFALRAESQRALMDFLDEPANSPRRERAGAYASYYYGYGIHRVRVIILDTRYHRESPGEQSDILGEEQWQWLRTELETSKSAVHVLVSSIQVLPQEHSYEKWADFPRARERLLNLLRETKPAGLFLISGDRHLSEISRLQEEDLDLWEVTASGMTHNVPSDWEEANRLRQGRFYSDLNFGWLQMDWEERTMDLQIRDREGNVVRSSKRPI